MKIERFGWIPDLKDIRDYRPQAIPWALQKVQTAPAPSAMKIPTTLPIFEQELGDCTANAVLRLYAHDEIRRTGKYTPLSRLFLYKATRDMLGWKGDSGATIRGTMKALTLLGCSPESSWPYRVSKFDEEPGWIAKGMAQSFQALRYVRLKSLEEIKGYLRAGFPVAFGFTCYESIDYVGADGLIPFPEAGEGVVGGHAITAEGYDDSRGCLRLANSWGPSWGDKGYAWLPYKYFEADLCSDYWVLLWGEHPEMKDF